MVWPGGIIIEIPKPSAEAVILLFEFLCMFCIYPSWFDEIESGTSSGGQGRRYTLWEPSILYELRPVQSSTSDERLTILRDFLRRWPGARITLPYTDLIELVGRQEGIIQQEGDE